MLRPCFILLLGWAASALSTELKSVVIEDFGSDVSRPLADLGWKGGHLKDGVRDFYLVKEKGNVFLRSEFKKTMKEAENLNKELTIDVEKTPWLSWRWRVQKFPTNANIIDDARSDAAAQVYLVWKSGLKHYVLKYFWSVDEKIGLAFRQTRFVVGNLFGRIIASGGPTNIWRTEVRNVYTDFSRAFDKPPPGPLRAIAVLSDGDETKSESVGDYDDFVLSREQPKN